MIIIAFALSACSFQSKSDFRSRTVRTATQFFGEFNNLGMIENDSFFVLNGTLGFLITLDDFGAIVPGLAERWTVSDDKRVYRFVLRKNVMYSDGSALKVEHVLFSLRRFLASEDYYAKLLRLALSNIKSISDREFEISFTKPVPRLIGFLASRIACAILHPEMVKKTGELDLSKPTLGVFRIAKFDPDSVLLEVRRDHPFYRTALPERIVIRNLNKVDSYRFLEKGELDLLFLGGSFDRKLQDAGFSIGRTGSHIVSYLRPSQELGCRRGFRRAVQNHLDRLKIVIDPLAEAANQLLPSNAMGAVRPNVDGKYATGMSKQKFPPTCKLKLCVLGKSSVVRSLDVKSIVTQLREIGFSVELKELESSAFSKELEDRSPSCDLLLNSSILEDNMTEMFLGGVTSAYVSPYDSDASKSLMVLFSKIHHAPTIEELAEGVRKLSSLIVREGYLIPIMHRPIYWAYKTGLQYNVDPGLFHTIRIADE